MKGEFAMPSLGADMERGTVLEWKVKPGDEVHRGDIVAVVDTEKSDIEVEIFEDGIIDELLVEPGVEVPVGTVLARLKAPAAKRSRPAPGEASPAVRAEGPPVHASPERTDGGGFVRASPRARRAAADAGVDLAEVAGSGPAGAVLVADLSPPRAPEGPPVRRQQAGPSRQAIAQLMSRSKREIPHYYLATTVDFDRASRFLAEVNATRSVTERVLPVAALLKATALACREVPVMNGHFEEEFSPAERVHLGVAVSLRGGGLVAPAIHDADRLSLDQLMAALRDLVGRARGGRLRGSEMSDPTITVTNLGDQGVEEVFGVIYPPQVALVGFGTITERPVATGGLLGVHPVVRATLSADHRASDGHDGARFLSVVDNLLQHPGEL